LCNNTTGNGDSPGEVYQRDDLAVTNNRSPDLRGALRGTRAKGRTSDIDLYERFAEIKEAAKDWLKDLGKNGYQHSERLERYLTELTKKLIERDLLTHAEIFVLLCATYMHDLGYWQNGQLQVKGHPERSRKLIEDQPDTYLLGDFPSLAGKIPGVAQAIGWVSYGHCEETYLPLAQVPNSFADQSISDETLNLRKLSALLRLADEADDPYIRLSEHETKSIRSMTPLVKIGEETIRWYWRETGAQDPGPWVRHLKEKQSILVTSIDYLRDLTKLGWYLVLEPQVPETTLPLPDEPSIAVLPFANMSDDPKQEFLSDGITEDIITALSKLHSLFVIARNSTFTYKGKAVKTQQVAEELGVRYVLEGSVQKAGDRVRITAQLIDAPKGYHLWSKRYDREFKDLLAMQDEITMKILAAAQVKLTAGEDARLRAKGTTNLEAYLALMQARQLMQTNNRENYALARRLTEQALALDPHYAVAYATLCRIQTNEVALGVYRNPREAFEQAAKLGEKAIALDDGDALAHAMLSLTYAWLREHDKAIAEAEKAVSLDPNSALAYHALGNGLDFAGRSQEAIPFFSKSLRLSPMPIDTVTLIRFGAAYVGVGQFEEAVASFKKALQLYGSDHLFAHLMLALTYVKMGREKEAQAEAAEVLRIDPTFSVESFGKRIPHKDQKRIDDAVSAWHKAGLK
jgi:TolB-like protein